MDINFSSDEGNDGGHVYAVEGEAMPRQLTPKMTMMIHHSDTTGICVLSNYNNKTDSHN
jgi:hypothetical protein